MCFVHVIIHQLLKAGNINENPEPRGGCFRRHRQNGSIDDFGSFCICRALGVIRILNICVLTWDQHNLYDSAASLISFVNANVGASGKINFSVYFYAPFFREDNRIIVKVKYICQPGHINSFRQIIHLFMWTS